jgi:hypothetical protein
MKVWNPGTDEYEDYGDSSEDLSGLYAADIALDLRVDDLEAGRTGASSGKIFYLSSTDASDIATYKTALPSPPPGAEATIATPCTGTSDVLVGVFATDPGVPGAVDYPAGTGHRRIYANVQAGWARFHAQVFKRTLDGTETLIRDEYSINFDNQTVVPIQWSSTSSTPGSLLATDRLVFKLYAQRVTGPTTVTVTTYYEGSAHVSQIQTTISAGTQGPPGPPGDFSQPQIINAQTGTTYTPVASDAGKLITLSNAAAITLTVPQDSDATIAVGTYIDLSQLGVGQVTIVAGTGATLRVSGLTAKSRAQYSRLAVQKVAANTWSLMGDLAAS